MSARLSPAGIRLLVSDVDGTLVTNDKRLTPGAQAAARAVEQAGIAFTVISSRPAFGMRMLVEPLRLKAPIAAFNGGLIVPPDRLDRLDRSGVIDHAYKIVGVSTDFELLARCERELAAELGTSATVARSQLYYLDVTHPLANKGHAVERLSQRLDIPASAIAAIGDGRNDMAMFAVSGLAIAMGNAAKEVQEAADFVSASNEEDGFAVAVERRILPRGAASEVAGSAREDSP